MQENKTLINILNDMLTPCHKVDYGIDSLFEDNGGLELTLNGYWTCIYIWEDDLYNPDQETIDETFKELTKLIQKWEKKKQIEKNVTIK